MAAEDAPCDIEELTDRRIADRVPDRCAFLLRQHHILPAQAGQMLGHDRLIQRERLLKLLHAPAAVPKNLQNADSSGMPERLEELRFQILQLERLAHSHRTVI